MGRLYGQTGRREAARAALAAAIDLYRAMDMTFCPRRKRALAQRVEDSRKRPEYGCYPCIITA